MTVRKIKIVEKKKKDHLYSTTEYHENKYKGTNDYFKSL